MLKKIVMSIVLTACNAQSIAQITSTQPPPQGTKELAIEEVIVRGSMLGQSIVEAPVSVTVLSQELIKKANISNLRDISKIAPNVSINQIGQVGSTSISIRGVQSNPFVVNRVAVYVDGIPFRDPATVQLNNIEQIEVLRGPQSALYGANANAGIVVITSQQPGPDTGGNIGVRLNHFEGRSTKELSGSAYGELNSDLGAVFNFRIEEGDSYVKNIASSIGEEGEIQDLALNTRLRYQISDDSSINMIAIYNKIDAPGLYGQEFPALSRSTYDARYGTANNNGLRVGEFEIVNDAPKQTNEEEWALGFVVQKEFDLGTLHWITSYRQKNDDSFGTDLDLTASAFSAGATQVDDVFWNVETRFTSSEYSAIQWVVGLNYFRQERARVLSTLIGPGDLGDFSSAPEQRFDAEDAAIFGQIVYGVSDHLDLTLGLRYETALRTNEQDEGSLNLGALGIFGFPAVSETDRVNTLIPKLAFNYIFNNNISLYTSMAKGYLPGGFNLVAAGNGSGIAEEFGAYDKEELWSYEIGSKGYIFDDRFFFSAAVFYIDASSWQENRILTDDEGRVLSTNLISSEAAIESKGIELELSGKLTDQLSMSLGLGYVDAKYQDYPFNNTQNLAGNSVYLIPEFDAYLGLTYQLTEQWYVYADMQAIGDTPLNPEGTAVRKNTYIGGLSVGYETDQWSATMFVENITNERYAAGQAYLNFLFGDDGNFYSPLGSPRIAGISANFKF